MDVSCLGKAGFPIFSTTIEANHVAKRSAASEHGSFQMDGEEKRRALRFAREPNAASQIVRARQNFDVALFLF